jgi:predicted nucleic-acid-binding Zn-ribbon protein
VIKVKIECNDDILYPLGGASYVFEQDLIPYILHKIRKQKIVISIGAQPNGSPHLGTISIFALAFSLGEALKKAKNNVDVSVLFEVVDTAPSETVIIDGIEYQKSLRKTGKAKEMMEEFKTMLEYFSKNTKINYNIRYQNMFNNQKEISDIIKNIVKKRDVLASILDPKHKKLRIRIECPKCGLTDKESANIVFEKNNIINYCPLHGRFSINYLKDIEKLEYNTPLRNLIRAMAYGNNNANQEIEEEIIRITGSDYAGFYQEELLYKAAAEIDYPIKRLPMILYSPLITDWSGAKLSKSLYVKERAYEDLPRYLLNLKSMISELGINGLKIMLDIAREWIDEPYKLFRNYSVYYFIKRYEDGK